MRSSTTLGLLAALLPGLGLAFNGSEHKLLGDLGASRVIPDPSITFASPTGFIHWAEAPSPRPNDLASYQFAKRLAVGFDTNVLGDFSPDKEKVQDNAYPPPVYGQRGDLEKPWALGNLFNWIPEGDGTALLSSRALLVEQRVFNGASAFTFGELVALYGDHRRTVHCIDGRCHLTNADFDTIYFSKGTDLRPDPMPSADYLRAIGSGTAPPFGALGNTFTNTAAEDQYSEAGWWGDEMLRIAAINESHFSTAALLWYVGMHRYALHYAALAIDDPRYWNAALSFEAHALHSLTDLFNFGHVVPNRDETSYGVMDEENLDGAAPYQWQQDVLAMGGAIDDARECPGIPGFTCRRLLFPDNTSELPEITAPGPLDRSDFMPCYAQGAWSGWALIEKDFHDKYNEAGACVRNLNGDSFLIYGDGRLQETLFPAERCGANAAGAAVAAEAVRASLQSLFDAHAALKAGSSVDELGRMGSPYFAALRHVPVYVIEDLRNERTGDPAGGDFSGCWTRYALASDLISGAGVVAPIWEGACQMPYINGGHTETGGCGCSGSGAATTPLLLLAVGAISRLRRRRASRRDLA